MIVIETSGPLFEGKIHVARGTREGMARATERAAEIARGHLRQFTRYSTPKYGRAASSVRTRLETVGGGSDQLIGRAFIGGQAAFLAPWLEFGTTAHFIAPRGRRRGAGRGAARGAARALAITAGGGRIFRAYAHHPGTRGRRWAAQTQAEINRLAPDIIRQALAESGA